MKRFVHNIGSLSLVGKGVGYLPAASNPTTAEARSESPYKEWGLHLTESCTDQRHFHNLIDPGNRYHGACCGCAIIMMVDVYLMHVHDHNGKIRSIPFQGY
jgi:hypothetical protein